MSSSNKNSPNRKTKRSEDKANVDYERLCKIIQHSSHTLKQIKNGQSMFHKNLIKEEYTIPFLNDDRMKQKLDTMVKMKEPNTQKGLMRSSLSKMNVKTSAMSTSPYVDVVHTFNTKESYSPSQLKDQSYYTTRMEDLDDNEYSSSIILPTDIKAEKKYFTAIDTFEGSSRREDLSKSLVQDSIQNNILMPPVALIDRKYNLTKTNLKKVQKDLSFPMNPAFISDPKFNRLPPLQDLITYCCNNNISFTPEENRFYKVNYAKKNHKLWAQSLNKLYDTSEMDIVDAIINFLKDNNENSPKLNEITERLKSDKNRRIVAKRSMNLSLNLSEIEGFMQKRELSFMPSAFEAATSKMIPKSKKLLSSSKIDNSKTPVAFVSNKRKQLRIHSVVKQLTFEGINDERYNQLCKQINKLEPAEIEQLVRKESSDHLRKTVRERYFKSEKNKNDTFMRLQSKLQEPLHLSDLKNKRKKNRSQRHSKKFASPLKNISSIGRGSKSPFRESNDKKLKKHCIQRLKLINRVELDRPILLASKMDVLWTKPTEQLPEINIARYRIEVSKVFDKSVPNLNFRKRNQSE